MGQTPPPTPPAAQPEAPAEADLDDVVACYRAQAQAAQALHGIDARHLADWRTNPHVVGEAVAARDAADRHIIELERQRRITQAQAEHRRGLDTVAAEDRWARAVAAREDRAISSAVAEADTAAADVAAISQAQAATRPATAASRLARTQDRIANAFLAFGAGGSVLSGIGLAHAVGQGTATGLGGAIATAVVIEVPTTILVAAIVWAQGYLARNTRAQHVEADGTRVSVDPLARIPAWARRLPWVSVAALLSVAVAVNAWGATVVGTGVFGVIGMVGAGVATLASFLSWAYSVHAAAAIAANMTTTGVQADLTERRQVAAGAHIPTRDAGAVAADRPAAVDAGTAHAEQVRQILANQDRSQQAARLDWELADQDRTNELFAAITQGLDDPEDGGENGGGLGAPAPNPTRPAGGPAAANPPSAAGGPAGGSGTHPAEAPGATVPARGGGTGFVVDQHHPGPTQTGHWGGGTGGTGCDQEQRPPHHQARAAQGEHNRDRVHAYIATHGPQVSNNQIGRALTLSRSTVREHRNTLYDQGFEVYPPESHQH